MIRQISEYCDLIFNIRKIKQVFSKGGYLHDNGWKSSIWTKKVINQEGKNVPWLTYSFIRFIEPRLNDQMKVLEYGSGYSTLWWGNHCKSVLSIETSDEWFDFVSEITKSVANVSIVKGDFSIEVPLVDGGYDICLVDDSGDRNSNIKNAVELLSPNGVMILDDAERQEYNEGIDFLMTKGFKKIDFEGLAPTIQYSGKLTSVFYRTENVLGI